VEILIRPKTDIGAVVANFTDSRYYPAAQPKEVCDIVQNFADSRYYLITAKDAGELTGRLLRTSQGGWLVPTETVATLAERGCVVIIRGRYPYLLGG
jgi:hypothetical protein